MTGDFDSDHDLLIHLWVHDDFFIMKIKPKPELNRILQNVMTIQNYLKI